ncbi:MAG: PQQ-binding-like beta-propeller repeat protein [Mariprofundaceae bacterium]
MTRLLALYKALPLTAALMLTGCAGWLDTEAEVHKPVAETSLQTAWSLDIDGRKPADALAYGRAAVSGHGDRARIVIGGRDGRAHVYDMSGSELFRIALVEACDSGAATLASGLVVLGDTGGILYGIDPVKGKLAWQFALSSPVTGVPLSVGDDVVVQTTDNRIYRINNQGEKRWSFAGQPGGLGLYLNASPLLHDNQLFALLTNGDAVALHADGGDLIWRKQLLLDTNAAHLSELKAPQARPTWVESLSLDGNSAKDVVLFSFYQGEIFALSRESGSLLLNHTLSLKSAPVVDKDVIYFASTQGVLQAIERRSGVVLWQQKLSKGELVGPVLWKNSLWLLDNEGGVFRLSRKGHIQAELHITGGFDRLPVVTERGLLVHSSLGGLYLVH